MIVGVTLYFLASLAEVRKAPFILLLVAFSGLDILGVLAAEAVETARGGDFFPFGHAEWWSLYFSPIILQYSSNITQLFWVPNHMAPGWWFALLVLLHARGHIVFSTLLCSAAPLFLWSPLAMSGAAPFVVLLALRLPLRQFFAADMVLATMAGLCLAPVALYLTMDTGAVPHEWLFMRPEFLRTYVPFVLIEIPQAAILVYAWRKIALPDRGPLAIALVLLLLIPLYSLGFANDFVMRASIPALFVTAFSFARVAVLTPRDGGAFASVISSLVLISVATPLIEIKSALGGAYAISDCNLLTVVDKGGDALPAHYLAGKEKIPDWLISLDDAPAPLTVEKRTCWPDHPLLPPSRR